MMSRAILIFTLSEHTPHTEHILAVDPVLMLLGPTLQRTLWHVGVFSTLPERPVAEPSPVRAPPAAEGLDVGRAVGRGLATVAVLDEAQVVGADHGPDDLGKRRLEEIIAPKGSM